MMIEEFLRSGALGDLHLGLSRDQVRQMLGEPPDHSEKNWKHEIWKYGGLQIAFSGSLLSFIGLYFENGEARLPASLVEDGNITIETDGVTELEELLRAKGIEFTVDPELTYDDYKLIRIAASGVGIGFTRGRLSSMQLMTQN